MKMGIALLALLSADIVFAQENPAVGSKYIANLEHAVLATSGESDGVYAAHSLIFQGIINKNTLVLRTAGLPEKNRTLAEVSLLAQISTHVLYVPLEKIRTKYDKAVFGGETPSAELRGKVVDAYRGEFVYEGYGLVVTIYPPMIGLVEVLTKPGN